MAASNQDGPDPTGARTPQEFMNLFRQARTGSGLSIVEIAEGAKQRGYNLHPADLARALAQPTLPDWQVVTGVLAACGYGGMQIDRWMRVFHDLASPAQPPAAAAAIPATPAPAPQAATPAPAKPAVPPGFADTAIDLVPVQAAAEPPSRVRARRRLALAAGVVMVVLIVLPLILFGLLSAKPGTVAAGPSSRPAATGSTLTASPTGEPATEPSPTEAASPAAPAPVTTTAKPPLKTTGPPPSPAPPAEPGVLHSGVVALTGNQSFNLDTGQPGGRADIRRGGSDSLISLNGTGVKPVEDMPTKQSCQAERGWNFLVNGLVAGQWLCVFTSERRLARLHVTAVGDTLKVAYTVWR